MSRARSVLLRTPSDSSVEAGATSFSYSTRGTSTKMSIRSSRGTANPLAVPANLTRRAGALVVWITVVPARTRVHRPDEHEVRRIGHRAVRAGYHHSLVFQRLSQGLQYPVAEFGQLVQEEHTSVAHRNFTWAGYGASADEASIGDSVVWRPERSLRNQRILFRKRVGDRIDLGDFDGLRVRQWRQD